MRTFTKILGATILSLSLTLFSSPSFAGTGDDVSLSVALSKSASNLKSGDSLNLVFTIENAGNNPITPRSVHYIFLPPELNFVSVSSSLPGLSCPINELLATNSYSMNFASKYDPYHLIGCFDANSDFLPSIDPGEKLTFTLSTMVVSAFNPGATSIVGFNLGNPDEIDYNTFTVAVQNASASGGDPATFSSNNVAKYVHQASPVTTTVSPKNTTSTTSRNTSTQTTARNGTTTTSGLASGESLATENQNDTTVSDDAQIAIGKKISLPDRISQQNRDHRQATFNGKYKTQLISFTILLLVAILLGFLLRRRYLRTLDGQKEYRDALKIMQDKKF